MPKTMKKKSGNKRKPYAKKKTYRKNKEYSSAKSSSTVVWVHKYVPINPAASYNAAPNQVGTYLSFDGHVTVVAMNPYVNPQAYVVGQRVYNLPSTTSQAINKSPQSTQNTTTPQVLSACANLYQNAKLEKVIVEAIPTTIGDSSIYTPAGGTTPVAFGAGDQASIIACHFDPESKYPAEVNQNGPSTVSILQSYSDTWAQSLSTARKTPRWSFTPKPRMAVNVVSIGKSDYVEVAEMNNIDYGTATLIVRSCNSATTNAQTQSNGVDMSYMLGLHYKMRYKDLTPNQLGQTIEDLKTEVARLKACSSSGMPLAIEEDDSDSEEEVDGSESESDEAEDPAGIGEPMYSKACRLGMKRARDYELGVTSEKKKKSKK